MRSKDELEFTVDLRELAHCKMCRDPLYCIYDWTVRDYCWECTCEMQGLDEEEVKASSSLPQRL